jgi:hypothetical protein
MESNICKFCGHVICRGKEGDQWRHYATLKAECDPPAVATPSLELYKEIAPSPENQREAIQ